MGKYSNVLDTIYCEEEGTAKDIFNLYVQAGYSVGMSTVEIETGTRGKYVVKRLDIFTKEEDVTMYELIDMQQDDVPKEILSETGVRKYAFEIVKDRAHMNDEHDSCGKEFIEWVAEGFDSFTWERATEVLTDWGYKVEEIN